MGIPATTTLGTPRRLRRSAGLALVLLAPLLAASSPPTIAPAPAPAACGIVPWTGSCACGVHGAVLPFARYAALLRTAGVGAETALRAERQSCRLPDSAAALPQSGPPPG